MKKTDSHPVNNLIQGQLYVWRRRLKILCRLFRMKKNYLVIQKIDSYKITEVMARQPKYYDNLKHEIEIENG